MSASSIITYKQNSNCVLLLVFFSFFAGDDSGVSKRSRHQIKKEVMVTKMEITKEGSAVEK